jgi:hypothetical protein
MTFGYAEDGVVVALFDPLLIEQTWSGADPERVRRASTDLTFGVDAARSDSLALVERLTHVRLVLEWLDAPHRCVDVPQPLA